MGYVPHRQPSQQRREPHDWRETIKLTALITATLILAFSLAFAARAGTPKLPGQTARTIVATWRCQDKLPQPRTHARSPWKPHSHGYRQAELQRWQHRLAACRKTLERRAYEWNWQQWLPDKWRRIGVCETQLNWRHYNSSYEGAFGFATSSWDAFKPAGYPDHASQASPWMQYQVALAIYRRYGLSGWGCRAA